MDRITLKATKRNRIGKEVKHLRLEGKIPAILYGKSMKTPIPVTMDGSETSKALKQISSSTLITIDVEGEEHMTLVRDFQVNPLRGELQHVDFLVVSLTETVRAYVSIVIEGEAPIIMEEGGLLVTGFEQIEVESLPQDLPSHLSIDVTGLTSFGDTLYVRDLNIPPGVEILTDLDELLIVATAPQEEVIEEPVEEDELLEGEELEEGEEGEEAGEEGDAGGDDEE